MLSERWRALRICRFLKPLADGLRRWACTRKTCSAFLKVNCVGKIVDQNLYHSHDADDPSRLLRQKVLNACKRNAVDDMYERPRKARNV